ncbi:hypothetical protein [Arthrobacter sp. OY3WO11]|uniref:hypothetical protein n=1 Tax=Arthrobacter sp. OY3WO11 TaxID=1835723 RepID=UPI000A4058FC|nr:hypothetical protein [Arthrobacter sp. OY3WO11]
MADRIPVRHPAVCLVEPELAVLAARIAHVAAVAAVLALLPVGFAVAAFAEQRVALRAFLTEFIPHFCFSWLVAIFMGR